MSFQLYPWQTECLQIWQQHHGHGIVNVVTGAGKTMLALAAIKTLETENAAPLRVKIIVPKTFMVSQWSAAMLADQNFLRPDRGEIGYYYALQKDAPDCKYMIYVINSARYSLARHISEDFNRGYSVLLIADECHHYASQENKKIFDFLPMRENRMAHYYSLGLSATPQVSGYDTVLVPALGTEIYQYGFQAAVAQRTIRNFAIFHIALHFSGEEKAEYEEMSDKLNIAMASLKKACPYLNGLEGNRFFGMLNQLANSTVSGNTAAYARSVLLLSYQRKGIVYSAETRISCACKLIENMPPHSKIMIFGERISQADRLFACLAEQYPNQVGRYHSNMEAQAQKNTIERYQNGEIRILVSCRALDEGFNIPATHIGIVLSSASIERQRIQRLGRILRRTHDTDPASLYYLYVEDSSEEDSFFSTEIENSTSLYLSYSQEMNRFSHPAYEERAERAMQYFEQQSLDGAALLEVKKCLERGMLLPDWTLGEAACRDKIRDATSTEMRNYWICMQQMLREL
ncbi:MAG: DEAD/DEAH box helicase family protein [Hungatella sp.]